MRNYKTFLVIYVTKIDMQGNCHTLMRMPSYAGVTSSGAS